MPIPKDLEVNMSITTDSSVEKEHLNKTVALTIPVKKKSVLKLFGYIIFCYYEFILGLFSKSSNYNSTIPFGSCLITFSKLPNRRHQRSHFFKFPIDSVLTKEINISIPNKKKQLKRMHYRFLV